ncbi:hypothetical protein [Blastococcus sp. SYSU D00695]
MSRPPARRAGRPPHYEIRLEGHLDPRWTAWFDGLSLRTDADGTTVLSGPVVDEAALHGLLQQVRDLGLPLLSLVRLDPTRTPGVTPTVQEEPS